MLSITIGSAFIKKIPIAVYTLYLYKLIYNLQQDDHAHLIQWKMYWPFSNFHTNAEY